MFSGVQCYSLPFLDERVGRRFGYSAARITPDSMALLGGASYFDTNLSDRPDLDKYQAVPFSQVLKLTLHTNEKSSSGDVMVSSLLPINENYAPVFPAPRSYFTSAVLSPGGEPVIVIFGGRLFDGTSMLSTKRCASLWCCDLKNGLRWFEPKTTSMGASPAPRCQHACTTLTSQSLLIHGGSGYDEVSLLGDLWTLHLGTGEGVVWTRLAVHGPSPCARKGHTLTAVSSSEAALFGGEGGEGNDLWMVTVSDCGTRASWTQLESAPSPRFNHCALSLTTTDMEEHTLRARLLVFGGSKSLAVFDFESASWTQSVTSSECPTESSFAEFFFYPVPERLVPSAPTALLLSGSSDKSAVKAWLCSLAGFDVRNVKADYSARKLRQRKYDHTATFKSPENPLIVTHSESSLSFIWSVNAIRRLAELFAHNFQAKSPRSPRLHDSTFSPIFDLKAKLYDPLPNVTRIDLIDSTLSYSEVEQLVNSSESVVPLLASKAASWILYCAKDARGSIILTIMNQKLVKDAHSSRFRYPIAKFQKTCPELLSFLRLIRCYSHLDEPQLAEILVSIPKGSSTLCLGYANTSGLQENGVLTDVLGSHLSTSLLSCFEVKSFKTAISKRLIHTQELVISKDVRMFIGMAKKGSINLGVVLFFKGRLIRRLSGILPSPGNSHNPSVSAIVDIQNGLIPDPTFTDFFEAAEQTETWHSFLASVYDACDAYLNRK